MKDKRPSFQFYPGDWMKDLELRSVSIAARGLWIDMLCLMFESVRRGYLQHATGKPVTAEQLARMTGCSTDEVSQLLQELEDSGVFSRTEHGAIFSRRMSKDERVRNLRSDAGKQGGNPEFERGKSNPYYPKDKQDKQPDKQEDKQTDKQKITPSSSASSSSSPSKIKDIPPAEKQPSPAVSNPEKSIEPDKKEPRKFWKEYIDSFCQKIAQKKGLRSPYKPTGQEIKALARIYDQFTPEDVLACWDMAWETEKPWSAWGAQNGRSIEWFCAPRTILTIMDDSRYKTKAAKIRETMGTDANSMMKHLKSLTKTEV